MRRRNIILLVGLPLLLLAIGAFFLWTKGGKVVTSAGKDYPPSVSGVAATNWPELPFGRDVPGRDGPGVNHDWIAVKFCATPKEETSVIGTWLEVGHGKSRQEIRNAMKDNPESDTENPPVPPAHLKTAPFSPVYVARPSPVSDVARPPPKHEPGYWVADTTQKPPVIDPRAVSWPAFPSAEGVSQKFCMRYLIHKTNDFFGRDRGIPRGRQLAFRFGLRVREPASGVWPISTRTADYYSGPHFFINDPKIYVHFVPAGYAEKVNDGTDGFDTAADAADTFWVDVRAVRERLRRTRPFSYDEEFWTDRLIFVPHEVSLAAGEGDVRWSKPPGSDSLIANPLDAWEVMDKGPIDGGLVVLVWGEGRGFAFAEALDEEHLYQSEYKTLRMLAVWRLFFETDVGGPWGTNYVEEWPFEADTNLQAQEAYRRFRSDYEDYLKAGGIRYATAPVAEGPSVFPHQAVHELGHVIANVVDEYFPDGSDGNKGPEGFDADGDLTISPQEDGYIKFHKMTNKPVNVVERAAIYIDRRWPSVWVENLPNAVPIPTPETTGGPGVFEGGAFRDDQPYKREEGNDVEFKTYRHEANCLMRSDRDPSIGFCRACQYSWSGYLSYLGRPKGGEPILDQEGEEVEPEDIGRAWRYDWIKSPSTGATQTRSQAEAPVCDPTSTAEYPCPVPIGTPRICCPGASRCESNCDD